MEGLIKRGAEYETNMKEFESFAKEHGYSSEGTLSKNWEERYIWLFEKS